MHTFEAIEVFVEYNEVRVLLGNKSASDVSVNYVNLEKEIRVLFDEVIFEHEVLNMFYIVDGCKIDIIQDSDLHAALLGPWSELLIYVTVNCSVIQDNLFNLPTTSYNIQRYIEDQQLAIEENLAQIDSENFLGTLYDDFMEIRTPPPELNEPDFSCDTMIVNGITEKKREIATLEDKIIKSKRKTVVVYGKQINARKGGFDVGIQILDAKQEYITDLIHIIDRTFGKSSIL